MISIVIPVYNVAPYIDECLDSVVKQSYVDWECILVDDGSTDGSAEKCDVIAKKDSRIRVYHQQNQGVSASRNFGIEQSKGEFIYFLDADDYCYANIFEYVDTEYDIVIGGYLSGNNTWLHSVSSPNNIPLAFLREQLVCRIGGFFVKKKIVESSNIRFEEGCKYGEDLDFILRVFLNASNVKICQEPFVYYRSTPNSAMTHFNYDRFDTFFSRVKLVDYAKERGNCAASDYLKRFSLIETLVINVENLLLTFCSVRDLCAFLKAHPPMMEVIKAAKDDKWLPRRFQQAAWLLWHCPILYKWIVVLKYKSYDLHAMLGKIKNKVLCVIG